MYDRLVEKIPSEQIFMDVDAVEPGMDFRKSIDEAISKSAALLAIVGNEWLDVTDPATGNRRLDQPNDFVRLEIEAALKHDIRVIPVLVDDAGMPPEDKLPESIRPFAYRNAVGLRHTRFNDDVEGIIDAVTKIINIDNNVISDDNMEDKKIISEPETINSSGYGFYVAGGVLFILIALASLIS